MNDVYVGLREQALRTTSVTAGASSDASGRQPYGVVTDWSVPNGYATVVAMVGGHASIYLSNGGGFIGGEGQEAIRHAARRAVDVAGKAVSKMHLTKEQPLPRPGDVAFYVLTRDGVMSASVPEAQVQSGDGDLAALYAAVQDVITQYRLFNSPPR